MTCMVLGEPEIAVNFNWEYPGQKVSRGQEEAVCMCICHGSVSEQRGGNEGLE